MKSFEKEETRHSLMLSVLLTLFLSACGADKSVDDWKSQRVAEELARVESVTGTYEGQATAQSSGQSLGLVRFEIQPKVRTSRSSDQLVSEINADLFARLTLLDQGNRVLTLNTGSILRDVESKPTRFTAVNSIVSLSDARMLIAEVNGNFEGDSIQGTASIQDFPEGLIRFNVRKVSSTISSTPQSSISRRSSTDIRSLIHVDVFRGKRVEIVQGKAVESPVELILFEQQIDPSVDLIANLMTSRPVIASLKVNGIVLGAFDKTLWDSKTGKLSADKVTKTSDGTLLVLQLRCENTDQGQLFCSFADSNRPQNFSSVFVRVTE